VWWARTAWNFEKKIQGSTDLPLSHQGMKEAKSWAERLKPKHYELIITSPMVRSQQTAEIISKILGIKIDFNEKLIEQNFGAWEGRKIADIRELSPGIIEEQEAKGWKFCPPQGESRTAVLERSLDAVKEIGQKYRNKKILTISHNSVIKTMIYHALGSMFQPGEPKLLKEYYLHELEWDGNIKVEKLNSIKLLQK
jgi:probable phosphoglycerate mutase